MYRKTTPFIVNYADSPVKSYLKAFIALETLLTLVEFYHNDNAAKSR